jgi:hypothetical protein
LSQPFHQEFDGFAGGFVLRFKVGPSVKVEDLFLINHSLNPEFADPAFTQLELGVRCMFGKHQSVEPVNPTSLVANVPCDPNPAHLHSVGSHYRKHLLAHLFSLFLNI